MVSVADVPRWNMACRRPLALGIAGIDRMVMLFTIAIPSRDDDPVPGNAPAEVIAWRQNPACRRVFNAYKATFILRSHFIRG